MSKTPPGWGEPFETVTANDHTAWIVIAATLGIVYSTIFLGFRIFIRRTSGSGRLSTDDAALLVATLVATIQSGVVLGACKSGLGKQWDLLDMQTQRRAQQMIYASNLLFVVALGISKASVFLFLLNITANPTQRRIFAAAVGSVIAWTVASFLAMALQCELSSAWQTSGRECSGLYLRWQVISAFDIVLEALAVCLAVFLVWDVQITFSKKWSVVSAFAIRLFTIITTVFRLTSFDESSAVSTPTFQAQFYVWLQAGMHLSTISATILILRPIIANLNTSYGSLGPTISHAYGGGSKDTYVMSNLFGTKRSQQEATRFEQSLAEPHGTEHIASATGGRMQNRSDGLNAETDSVGSEGSQRMIIKKNTSWTIETYQRNADSDQGQLR